MEEDVNLRKKSELSLGGGIKLPRGFAMPFRLSRSTAGPGAGSASAVFAFGRYRVKKGVSYDSGEFELHEGGGRLYLTRGGEPFLDEVTIQPVVFHCPEQAFFNLDQRCMFSCAFCASPRLDKGTVKDLSPEAIVSMVRGAMDGGEVRSVSLTSGVVDGIDQTVERMAAAAAAVRREFPGMPIGVEPYVSRREHLEALREAGASEAKLNAEAARRDIFEKVCPDLDYGGVFEMLEAAVEIFGRGNVTSNVIYGLGESDEDLAEVAERLCAMGVIPTLRALRRNAYNGESLDAAIGSVPPVDTERALRAAGMLKSALERHGLNPRGCRTMCLECGCCDLVPFRDL
ncbi:MAG: radical SAM protein [Candidatus Methanoplasma sp.]|jgi:biotin synthase-related radical SAM superfamily protein|nr:radical SAM protein [Candidatus Methanoplasma sp.]